MKKLALVAAVLVCFVSIIGGKFYYDHKVGQISRSSEASSSELTAGLSVNDDSGMPIVKQIDKLPPSLQEAARHANKTGGQVQLALVGDASVQTYASLLQARLDATFGQSFFKVIPLSVGAANSLQFNQLKMKKLFQAVNGKPDAVIDVPLIYNDDHQVRTDDTATVMSYFKTKVKESYPKAAFFALLPNPSPKFSYMSDRLATLASYLNKQKIHTIAPFSHLPRSTSLKTLVGSDGRNLSSKGQTYWMNAVAKDWNLKSGD
ncbi:MAG: hypothetical protein ABF586_13415 [Sporolactobacillus sp.]